jgi:pantoate--beta-alanine ligase
MEIARTIAAAREQVAAARRAGRTVGFVPTMGFLHEGHLSLVSAARRETDFVAVSIFVNPTQFGPNEDYARYPRNEAADLEMCASAGVDLVFIPDVDAMYPAGEITTVHVDELTTTLCGPCRPGHFDGVTTVVTKLFNIVQPDRAYFGKKDYQQFVVLRRMARDLDMPIDVIGCPLVREPDGLAMSSRNALLTPDDRRRARSLHQALCAARDAIATGERNAVALVTAMHRVLERAAPEHIDYVSVADPDTLQGVPRIDGPVLLALAVRIGDTRLIDNMVVDPTGPPA